MLRLHYCSETTSLECADLLALYLYKALCDRFNLHTILPDGSVEVLRACICL